MSYRFGDEYLAMPEFMEKICRRACEHGPITGAVVCFSPLMLFIGIMILLFTYFPNGLN